MKLYDKYYNELLKDWGQKEIYSQTERSFDIAKKYLEDCGIDYTEYNSLSTEELDELSWKFFQLKKDKEEEMLDCLIMLFTRLYVTSIFEL